MNEDGARAEVARHFRAILREVGEDPERPGLRETPERIARAWLDELLIGYRQDPMDVFKVFDGEGCDEMILVRDTPFTSVCEHHMLLFTGRAHVGYIPEGQILGLSKIARLVDVFARRLQTQERLTQQIADALVLGLKPKGVAVVLEAEHSCIAARGVRKSGSSAMTSAMRGVMFTVPAARAEFFSLLSRGV